MAARPIVRKPLKPSTGFGPGRGLTAAAVLLAVALGAVPAQGQAPAGERADAARLAALVQDLRQIVADAEQSGGVPPEVVDRLRLLIERYDVPYPHLIVRDAFRDGTLSRDPPWRVLSGDWQAVAGSVVSPPAGPAIATPEPPAQADAEGLQDKLNTVTRLVERLQSLDPTQLPEAAGRAVEADGPARLALPLHLPHAFRVALRFALEDEPGRHAVALVLEETRNGRVSDGWRLSIEPFGRRSRLTLERLSGIGGTTLGSTTLDISLAGGEVHRLALERSEQGVMTLRLNEAPILRVQDRRFPPTADRLLLERSGGRLIVSEVEVLGR